MLLGGRSSKIRNEVISNMNKTRSSVTVAGSSKEGIEASIICSSPKNFIDAANAGHPQVLPWVDRLHRKKQTKALLHDLDAHLRNIRMTATLRLNKETLEFEWEHKVDGRARPGIETAYIASFVQFLRDGAFDNLGRCPLRSKIAELAERYPSVKSKIGKGRYACNRLFIGNGKREWCSDNCRLFYVQAERRARKKLERTL